MAGTSDRARAFAEHPLRCPQCRQGMMREGHFPWRPRMAFIMKCTILLFPLALIIMSKPDYYECPKCSHKKGSWWM